LSCSGDVPGDAGFVRLDIQAGQCDHVHTAS